jgi:hypothetical protein
MHSVGHFKLFDRIRINSRLRCEIVTDDQANRSDIVHTQTIPWFGLMKVWADANVSTSITNVTVLEKMRIDN